MIKYGTCDRCGAVCETLHESRGAWVCARHNDEGTAAPFVLGVVALILLMTVPLVMFAALLAGSVAGVAS